MQTPSITNTILLTGAAARSRDAADSRAKIAWEKYQEKELAMIQICDQATQNSAESIEKFIFSIREWRNALTPLYDLAPRWVPEIKKDSIRQGYGLAFNSISGVYYDKKPEEHARRLARNLNAELAKSAVPTPELAENAALEEISQWINDIRAIGVS